MGRQKMAASGSVNGLRPREQRAIAALLTEPTMEKAAKAAGIGSRTLYRWMARDDFREAFDQARREALRGSLSRLQAAAGEAVEALREVVNDGDARPGERVGAARTVLGFALRGAELLDLEERLAALEAAADGRGGRLQ